MATAIPQAFVYEILSRLPPNSWVIDMKEVRPDVEPIGGAFRVDSTSNVTLHIRGAPNEYVLNQDVVLAGDVSVSVDYSGTALAADLQPREARNALFHNADDRLNLRWRAGPTWVDSSRESFNSGSLPYLENTDTSNHLARNNLRCLLAKRANDRRLSQGIVGAPADTGRFEVEVQDLAASGWYSENRKKGINVYYQNTGVGATRFRKVDNGVQHFEIPLGLYSSLINCPNPLPIGLFSAYSVNGMSIELRLPDIVNATGGNVMLEAYTAMTGRPVGLQNGVISQKAGDGYRNIRLYVPVVKVLDPAAQEAILSLYEKRQMVNVGGVQFPMSLRLNSVGYRNYRFSLTATQGDYYFRLPSTDRSVRALAWMLVNSDNLVKDAAQQTSNAQGVDTPVLTRLECTAGSLQMMPVVEDRTPYDRNIVNFLSLQERRSASVFSPFTYWQEAMRHMGQQCDKLKTLDWADRDSSHKNRQYGVISFENWDQREPDFSTSFQSTGIDLNNVGGLDLRMRWNHLSGDADTGGAGWEYTVTQAGTGVANAFANSGDDGNGPGAAGNWTLLFMLAYDSVHEVSPSGVVDITGSVF